MDFQSRLKDMGYTTYIEYLESDIWKDFRRRYRRGGNRVTCTICNSPKIQLHHITYVRLGSEEFTDVIPLCDPHHKAVHEWLTNHDMRVEKTHLAIDALGGPQIPSVRDISRKKRKIAFVAKHFNQLELIRYYVSKRLVKAKTLNNIERYCDERALISAIIRGREKAAKKGIK